MLAFGPEFACILLLNEPESLMALPLITFAVSCFAMSAGKAQNVLRGSGMGLRGSGFGYEWECQ